MKMRKLIDRIVLNIREKSLIFLVFALLVGLIPSQTNAVAGVPELLSYQGRLTDTSGNLLGGAGTDYCFRFSIWDDVGPTQVWPVGTPGENSIEVKNGVFNAFIGTADTLDYDFQTNDNVYLNVALDEKTGGACGDDEVFTDLSPRQRIVSSGFSINSDTVDGFHASQTAGANEIPVLDGSGALNLLGDLTLDGALTLDDNTTDSLDIEQGSDNYFNISTVNGSEEIFFGNTATNPDFTFLGSGVTTISGNLVTPKGSDYPTTGTQNDVNLGTGSLIRYTGAGIATFTGLSGGVDGRTVVIMNASSSNLIVSNQNASSIAANRIITANGADITVAPDISITVQYDSGASRWRLISLTTSALIGSTFSQGGNSFGTTATLGTSDAFNLNLVTAGNTRFTVDSGAPTLTGGTGTTTFASAAASALNVTSGTTGALTLDSGTTGAINIGTGASGKTINIGTDNSAPDTITIGSASDTVTITATDLIFTAGADITSAGGLAFTPGAATDFFNILNGNLKVGDGTPDVTLNGEDAYIEGTLEVDGATRLDGALTSNSDTTIGDALADILTFTGTIAGASPFVFEGGAADANELTLAVAALTSDHILTLPNETGTLATQDYADTITNTLVVKESVRVATTVAGTLASDFENGDTVDGVGLVTGDRILIKNQATGSENGIYTVNASGSPTRSTDADSSAEVPSGIFTFVTLGTANADSGWILTTDDPITLGVTSLTFTQFAGAGDSIAGTGLTKTGNSIDAIGADGITANADDLEIDLLDTVDGTGSAVSVSGLEFQGTGSDELTLLQGCADGDILKWDDVTDQRWECMPDNDSGGSTLWNDIGNATANGAIAMSETVQTMDWNTDDTTAATFDGLSMTVSNDAATDASIQRALVIQNKNTAATNTTEALLVLENADATAGAIVSSAMSVISSGGVITTALDLSDSDIVTALSIGANDVTATNWSIAGATGDILTSGAISVDGTTTLSGNFATPAVDFPTAGTTHDLSFTGSLLQYSAVSDSTNTITGFTGVSDGRFIRVMNASAFNLTFKNLSGSSAGNQINTTTGADLVIPSGISIGFQYDSAGSVWRVVVLPATATTLALTVFLQNGNTFGSPAVFGTNDASTLSLETSGTTRLTLSATAATLTGTGATTLTTDAGSALTLDTGTTGTLNIGTGTSGKSINVGTDNTNADTITIGSALDNVAITGDQWSITDAGALTVTSCTGCGGGAFTSAGGIIDKATASDRLRLVYGDAGDVQFEIENTTNAVVPTTDAMQINLTGGAGVTTDGVDGLYINIEGANGTTNTVSALHLDFDPIGGASGDEIFNGLLIDGITAGSATENALNIGTGWDNELSFSDTSPTIKLAATDNTATLSIVDVSGNNLLNIRDLSTNFGAATTSGAFISRNSMFAEEYNMMHANTTNAASAQVRGDSTELSTSSIFTGGGGGTGTFATQNTTNGVERLTPLVNAFPRTAAMLEYLGTTANNVSNDIYLASNLPVITMKMKVNAAINANRAFIGISNSATATSTMPTSGIFFSNCTASDTCGSNWNGVVNNAGTVTTVLCGAVDTSNFAYGRIEVRSTTDVHFFMDTNVSNGVVETECGTGLTATPAAAMTILIQAATVAVGSVPALMTNFDIDYFRSWQDDNATSTLTELMSPLITEAPVDAPVEEVILINDLNVDAFSIGPETNRTVTIDIDGNALFAGTVTVNKLIANEIEWPEMLRLTSRLDQVEQGVESLATSDTRINADLADLKIHYDELALQFNNLTTSSLQQNTTTPEFDGLIVSGLTQLGDVEFGRPYFTNDTAGFAKITEGDTEVIVEFEREYIEQPIVSVNITLNDDQDENTDDSQIARSILAKGYTYIVGKKSEKGFTIYLNKVAEEDVTFSWIALAVRNAKLFTSINTTNAPLTADTLINTDSADEATQVINETSNQANNDLPVVELVPEPVTEPASEPTPVVPEPAVELTPEPVIEPAPVTELAPATEPEAVIQSSSSDESVPTAEPTAEPAPESAPAPESTSAADTAVASTESAPAL